MRISVSAIHNIDNCFSHLTKEEDSKMFKILPLLLITHYTSVALISIQPAVIIKQPGQTLSIECNSSSTNATVQWTLPNNVQHFTGRLLVKENISSRDSGVYECSVGGESATTDVYIC